MWGSSDALHKRSWMQFVDDAALITHDANGVQTLLNIATAWCSCADMKLRINKCSTFGMQRTYASYVQFQPVLCVGDQVLPPVEMDKSFKYLGKLFNFGMREIEIKEQLEERLSGILITTSCLKIKPQTKLRILRLYLPTQFTFELRVYEISLTWITQHLDAMIDDNVRRWLALPVSSCVSEILSLPKSKGGFSVTLLKSLTEKLHMTQSHSL